MEEPSSESDRQTVVISLNPNSGSTDRRSIAEELESKLRSGGLSVEMHTRLDDVCSTVTRLQQLGSPVRAVVAAGGDGTVSLLANRLPPQTPIAILPLGTENLLAKYLGLSAEVDRLAETIFRARCVRLDAGRANGQLFLVMASCGFDAEVVHRLHLTRKGHIHHWSYARPIVDAIGEYRYPRVRIYVDDADKPISAKWAFIFNVPRYAMNLPIVADADPTDGLLDLCTFRGGNLIRGLFYLSAILLRQHRGWKYSQVRRFRKIRIEADERVPFQLDGDPGGVLPLEIEVVREYLNVLVPSEWEP